MAVLTDYTNFYKQPARVASTVNVPLNSHLPVIDGVQTVVKDRVLLLFQTTPVDNGIYVVGVQGLTKATDWINPSSADDGAEITVLEGQTYANKIFNIHSIPPASFNTAAKTFALSEFVGANPGAGAGAVITNITFSALYGQYVSGTMVAGMHFITDAADKGVYVNVIDAKTIENTGKALFLVPDFYGNRADYSGIFKVTGVAYTGNMQGIWIANNDKIGIYGLGDLVIWNNTIYQLVNLSTKNTLSPDQNPGYAILNKTAINVGYVVNADLVGIDMRANAGYSLAFKFRQDILGNTYYGDFYGFSWGNYQVANNMIYGSIGIINHAGAFYGNIVDSGTELISSGTTSGNIVNNRFSGPFGYNLSGVNMANCNINASENITFVSGKTYDNCKIDKNESTFVEDMDITGLTAIDLHNYNYVGTFRVNYSDNVIISSITNMNTFFPVTFQSYDGAGLVTFLHNAPISDNLQNIGGKSASIYCNNKEWITYKYFEGRIAEIATGVYSVATANEIITQTTYAGLYSAYTNSALIVGKYEITDYMENGVITPLFVTALTNKKLAVDGFGLFKNADYNATGVYDVNAVLTVTDIDSFTGNNQGVWEVSREGVFYGMGAVVIWNNKNYVVINNAAFNGTAPDVNDTAYIMLDANIAGMGYVTSLDAIKYNVAVESGPAGIIGKVLYRADVFGNEIWNYSAGVFQFGNKLVTNCKVYNGVNNNSPVLSLLGGNTVTKASVHEGAINNINNRGIVNAVNVFNNSTLVITNNVTGTVDGINISGNNNIITFDMYGDYYSIDINVNSKSDAAWVVTMPTRLLNGVYLLTGQINDKYSTFGVSVNGTIRVVGEVLNFNNSHYGVVGISSDSNAMVNIQNITNMPKDREITFIPVNNIITILPGFGIITKINNNTGANSTINLASGDYITLVNRETYPGSGVFAIYQVTEGYYTAIG